MKYTKVKSGTLLCVAFVLGSIPFTVGQTVVLPPPVNYEKIALLKWYAANLTTAFPAGPGLWGVAFDGANIGWRTPLGRTQSPSCGPSMAPTWGASPQVAGPLAWPSMGPTSGGDGSRRGRSQ